SQQRGLAASRRPEQHHELAIAGLEADAVDGRHVAELFPDLVDSNRGHVDLLDGHGVAVPRSLRPGAGDLMHPPGANLTLPPPPSFSSARSPYGPMRPPPPASPGRSPPWPSCRR